MPPTDTDKKVPDKKVLEMYMHGWSFYFNKEVLFFIDMFRCLLIVTENARKVCSFVMLLERRQNDRKKMKTHFVFESQIPSK